MPPGRAVNFRFQTIDDAIKLIDKDYYLTKVDLSHVYHSINIHSANYDATGLKWTSKSDN